MLFLIEPWRLIFRRGMNNYLKLFAVLIPTVLIGGFEYIRHIYLLPYLSMSIGNLIITLLTFIISFIFATWMFNTIRRINERLVQEQAIRAVYEERNRLYREFHDGIAQTLFFLNIQLKQGKIEEAQTAVAEINNDVRQIIFNLRCSLEEGYSLKERIHKWLYEWGALTGIDVTQTVEIPEKFPMMWLTRSDPMRGQASLAFLLPYKQRERRKKNVVVLY